LVFQHVFGIDSDVREVGEDPSQLLDLAELEGCRLVVEELHVGVLAGDVLEYLLFVLRIVFVVEQRSVISLVLRNSQPLHVLEVVYQGLNLLAVVLVVDVVRVEAVVFIAVERARAVV